MGAPDASSPYAQPPPSKRQRQSSFEEVGTTSTTTTTTTNTTAAAQPSPHQSIDSKASASSNFRNVSACNRCRLRKNRCDQRLPSCASCAKANVACVGYDPITKKEIPRSYVFYLETRVEQLEGLLRDHGIDFPAAENLENCSRPAGKGEDGGAGKDARPRNPAVETLSHQKRNTTSTSGSGSAQSPAMQNISSKPKSLASASGVSFARVVFAAVQYSVSDQSGHPQDRRHPGGTSGTSMRDSFFGLHTKPSIQPATFPSRDVGMRLVTLYFEHANPQIPIMHRGEFMKMFEAAYAQPSQGLGPRESYVLNMVFAIGCGVIVGEPVKSETSRMAVDGGQCQPEEYHASAIVHLEACLSNSGGGLEVLQAVLLLANFALLRPVPPGLWYIIGVAVRLAVDLGLHREDGMDVDALPEGPLDGEATDGSSSTRPREGSAQERGRRQWIRDMRRRLWWCTYSFDRLVSTCVGRPFGISDQVITTDLPSILDDDYITPGGIMEPQHNEMLPSYKHVAHHYFRLRMLQSEILQVLQYQQSQIAKAGPQGTIYPEMHTHLPSPFLVQFDSFRSWRRSIDERLFNWKQSAPTRHETGVAFSTEFLELNYWQAIITLYRQSLSVPAMFEGEYNTSNEVDSPQGFTTAESREDEDKIYLKVAEAGQKILRIYRQLHLTGLVSYTYLSTHHLFMAGISYLYAIWHSHTVRSCLTMDEVDFTVLAAKSVFTDMIDKCPPAETCRDAFDRTARATIKMASSNGGFGAQASASVAAAAAQRHHHRTQSTNWPSAADPLTPTPQQSQHRSRPSEHQQQPFHFDLSLSDTLSSPTMSVQGGDVGSKHSPALSQQAVARGYDNEYMMTSQDNHAVSPASSIKQEPNNSQRQPPPLRRLHSHPAGNNNNNTFMGQQFGLQGSMDYPDTQTMDFLQSLGAAPNGGVDMGSSSVDQAQVDLGFGINWEGLPNDYGDNQQMNPFDTFFFGAQQQGGGGPNGNMGL